MSVGYNLWASCGAVALTGGQANVVPRITSVAFHSCARVGKPLCVEFRPLRWAKTHLSTIHSPY